MAKTTKHNIAKEKRIDIRITSEQKREWEQRAKETGLSLSAYICTKVDNTASITSHEENITNSLKENCFIHSLLCSPDLSDKSKQFIIREMKKYV